MFSRILGILFVLAVMVVGLPVWGVCFMSSILS